MMVWCTASALLESVEMGDSKRTASFVQKLNLEFTNFGILSLSHLCRNG